MENLKNRLIFRKSETLGIAPRGPLVHPSASSYITSTVKDVLGYFLIFQQSPSDDDEAYRGEPQDGIYHGMAWRMCDVIRTY